ncbi:alpha/beta hydrolase [Pontibacter sp. KCTC 32443]|uniref:alpha/beta fold hydrolase n=1 Tax=Pontibacter TaxID=323449 RepID=UPI00164E9627|nr:MULTISPECIES: alpha/beta hydrolase [Pontibacter]MBC5772745.1 alpha/beta hydrolase [Pontibacter sp. KCTC 32443]
MKNHLLSHFLFLLLLTCSTLQAQTKSFYFTTSDSVQLYVRVAGQGKPCLFIHGGPGSWTKYYYALGGNITEQDMTMIYVDQRGSGRSGGNASTDYSLARVVKDFEEIRAHLGYDKWIVMPHSFGGTIATEYAYTYPTRVLATIYVNTTLNLDYAKSNGITQAARILNVPESEFLKPGVSKTQAFGAVWGKLNEQNLAYKMMYRDKEMFDKMAAVMDTTLNGHFGSNVWNYTEYEQDFTMKSASIKSPVLVFTGLYDYSIGPDHYKSFQFQKATYKVMKTGHCPYQEQPDTFRKHIRKFIAKLD